MGIRVGLGRRMKYSRWSGSVPSYPAKRHSRLSVVETSSDADDEQDDLDLASPKILGIMDSNSSLGHGQQQQQAPPSSRPRRRSALALADRLTTMVSLRRGTNSRSRSRSGSDAISPQSARTNSSNVLTTNTRSRGTSRDHSACTTEDDRESSEDPHSVEDDMAEFGYLLEDDPFANLSTPPSECQSPLGGRTWIRQLSSTDVIREEPEEMLDDLTRKRLSMRRASSTSALHVHFTTGNRLEQQVKEEDEGDDEREHDDGDATSSLFHEIGHASTSALPYSRDEDVPERKRSNSLTERVRHIVQSRPSLPSLSILANTKIFLPHSSKSSSLAARFPSEPWDDPKYTQHNQSKSSLMDHIRTVSSRREGRDRSNGSFNQSGGFYDEGNSGFQRRYEESGSDGAGRMPGDRDRAGGGAGGGNGGRYPSGNGPHSSQEDSSGHTTSETTNSEDEDSDNVPLGHRPNAFSAQKSLRMRIKDERRSRKETIKASRAAPAATHLEPTSSTSTKTDNLSADDLTARLLRLRATESPSLPASPTGRTAFPTLPTSSMTKATSPLRSPIYGSFPAPAPQPIPSSSAQASTFAFPSSSTPMSPPAIKRHATDAAGHGPPHTALPRPTFPTRSMTSFDSPRTAVPGGSFDLRRPSDDAQHAQAPLPTPSGRLRADTLLGKLVSSSGANKLRQRATSLHSSKAPHPMPQVPLPPLPLSRQSDSAWNNQGERSSAGDASGGFMMQQRIFIGDMQRFGVVEIGSKTNARDVVEELASRGDLAPEEVAQDDWMVFEMANDFGMERPIREYELLMEVYNSWNSDTRMNYFMLKRTPLAPYLAAEAMPKASPTYSGYVEWEQKRGKWTKRWLELREHSLWLSKRQGAKDATHLCTLSNFDAYNITRIHKSPKPYTFSVKSVQNMRLFESMTDYHHVFSCDAMDGGHWVHNILLARSYVLHQERTALFRQLQPQSRPSTATSPSPGPSPAPAVSRSGTRRAPPAPLLLFQQNSSATPPMPSLPTAGVTSPLGSFQPVPGSLLSKRL